MSLRDELEIQRAHDILIAVILGDVPVLADRARVTPAIDALCWVLGHDHNTAFAENLAELEAEIAGTGATLVDLGKTVVPEP